MVTIEGRDKSQVEEALFRQATVVLLGVRQTGKTTLALEIAKTRQAAYLALEQTGDRQILEEPELYLDEQVGRLVIIDEVQVYPELFQFLRKQIDARRRTGHRTGQFLLLGSASDALLHQGTESLAGRVHYHELGPFDALDTGSLGMLWRRGGFPDSYLLANDPASYLWRDDFIRSYLVRDVRSCGRSEYVYRSQPFEDSGRCWRIARVKR